MSSQIQRREIKTQRIFITSLLITLALFGSAFPQAMLKIGDKQVIQLHLDRMKCGIQQSRPGKIISIFTGEITMDGRLQSTEDFTLYLDSLISNLPPRDIYVSNPAPDRLGPFWDFEIIRHQYEFSDTSCIVTCQYRLSADGAHTAPAVIELRRQGRLWQVARIDGLIDFLSQPGPTQRRKLLRGGVQNE